MQGQASLLCFLLLISQKWLHGHCFQIYGLDSAGDLGGAEVQTCQQIIMSRVMRTDLSRNDKSHVQPAFRIINGSCSTLPNLLSDHLSPPLLRPTPHPLPSIRLPTTISTAPSTAPPSIIPRSTTSPTLPHRLLIHRIFTQRARIPRILNATAAVDRARRSVFIVVSAEVAVIEIAVAVAEVDALFVARCASE